MKNPPKFFYLFKKALGFSLPLRKHPDRWQKAYLTASQQ
jgi:hypothetical protein